MISITFNAMQWNEMLINWYRIACEIDIKQNLNWDKASDSFAHARSKSSSYISIKWNPSIHPKNYKLSSIMSMRFNTTSPSQQSSQSLPNSKISDTISISSTTSAFSTGPDRHGFYGGTHFTDKPKVPLSKAQVIAREKKWLHMLSNWWDYNIFYIHRLKITVSLVYYIF